MHKEEAVRGAFARIMRESDTVKSAAIEGAIERIRTLSKASDNEWGEAGDWDNWNDHGL